MLPPNVSLGMMHLQYNGMLKGNYQEKNPTEFYKSLLRITVFSQTHAWGLISVIWQYIYVKTFSKMKYIKSYYKSALTGS